MQKDETRVFDHSDLKMVAELYKTIRERMEFRDVIQQEDMTTLSHLVIEFVQNVKACFSDKEQQS